MAAEILSYGIGGRDHPCSPAETWRKLAGAPPAPGAKLRCDCGQVWLYRSSLSNLARGRMVWGRVGETPPREAVPRRPQVRRNVY